jgi:hypothetical protein
MLAIYLGPTVFDFSHSCPPQRLPWSLIMSHLSKIFGLSSVCLAVALLSSRPVQADDLLGASVFFMDSGASLVGSLIQVDGHLDVESGELALPATDSHPAGFADVARMAPARLGMARPQIRSLTTNATIAPATSVATGTSRDAFRFSRAALPLLIDTLPGIAETSFAQARPMVGPVVGVRPSYVKAASYR